MGLGIGRGDAPSPEASHPHGHGAGPAAVREVNRSLVLRVIKAAGPISRSAIADEVGLTKPTVSSIVDALIQDGFVRETGHGATARGGGRRPILLEYDALSEYVVGAEVGVRSTTLVLADGAGREVGRSTFRTPRTRPGTALRRVGERVQALVAEAEVDAARVVGTAIAVPGLVDSDHAVCLLAPNLGWRQVDVAGELAGSAPGPVFVHNTTQAEAVAESVEGAAVGERGLVYLHASTGVGACVLVDRQVFHGQHGLAGEIGHCYVPGGTIRCECGNVGCVETLASGPAIGRAAADAIASGRRTTLEPGGDGEIGWPDVIAAAADGDRLATQLIGRAGEALGTAASWLVNIVDPDAVVVGGGLLEAGPALLEPLETALREHVLNELGTDLKFSPAQLGSVAAARGAVLLARQHTDGVARFG